MKKTLLSMLMSAVILVSGTVAFAYDTKDVYNGVSDSLVNLNTTGGISPQNHKTIIISRVADIDGTALTTPEYVYIDQGVSEFSLAVEFMLDGRANNPGYYKAQFGGVAGDGTTAEPVYFIVGDFDLNPDDKLTVAEEPVAYGVSMYDEAVYYKKSFKVTTTCEQISQYNSIKLINEEGTKCIGAFPLNRTDEKWEWTNYSGAGEITVALQVYGISEEHKGFNMYFSVEDAVPVQ